MIKADIEKIIKRVQSDSDKKMEKMMKRHTGALLEEFQHRVSVIGEQYSGIKKILDEHTKTLDSHAEEIAKLSINMTEIRSDVKELRVDMMEVKSDTKDTKFFAMNTFNSKVDKKHFVDLEGRVRVLEKV